MLEELKSDKIIDKVGGKFKLAALVQRRMEELLQGARPLIDDASGLTMLEIVVQEILQDKITMGGAEPGGEFQGADSTGAGKPSGFGPADDGN